MTVDQLDMMATLDPFVLMAVARGWHPLERGQIMVVHFCGREYKVERTDEVCAGQDVCSSVDDRLSFVHNLVHTADGDTWTGRARSTGEGSGKPSGS